MSMSDDAAKHILGYTLLNDFSARDTQRVEMAMSTGPYKGKDFAWGLGPWIVTPDEFGEVAGTKMRVLVNGEVWAQSTPGAMQWTFPGNDLLHVARRDRKCRRRIRLGHGEQRLRF